MDCVITAGGAPGPEDPLYPYTNGKSKALIEMNGRTMLERVVDALQGSQSVDNVIVVGLGDDMGMQFNRPVQHLPDQGSLVGNAIGGIQLARSQNPDSEMVIVGSADIPTITPEMVDEFVASCQPFDCAMYYNFVTQKVMEARFPGSNRTFVKLKGANVAGGDMILVRASLADSHLDLWEALANGRKHAWMLARVVGLRFLLKFLFRRIGPDEIAQTFERIIDAPARVLLSPHAEMAMDADKPHQVDLLRRDLTERGA
ncbi:MAG: nucleotidyltransferase family protein [Anaerolineae bacterium]